MKGRLVDTQYEGHLKVIGRLKVGEKKKITDKNGKEIEIPVSLDHFKADGKFAALFHKTFGEKPQRIKIIFVSNEIEQVCNLRYEFRKDSAKLYARGDGKSFDVWDGTKYVPSETDVETLTKKYGEPQKILTIRFLLPEMKGVFGLWQFSTRGENSIGSIVATFDKIMDMAGTIINVPFELIVEKVTSQKPDSKHSFPIVSLIPNLSRESLEIVKLALEQGKEIRGLITDEKVGKFIAEEPDLLDYSPDKNEIPVNTFPEDSPELQNAKKMLQGCKAMKDLADTSVKIRKLGLNEDDSVKARIIYTEIMEGLKNVNRPE